MHASSIGGPYRSQLPDRLMWPMRVDVGPLADFLEGAFRLVRVDGAEVGVILWAGDAYAFRNSCPHQFGPLCAGRVRALLTADGPGRPSLDAETPVVSCPWHGWEFDARTGSSLWGGRYRASRVPASIDRGRIVLDLPVHSRSAVSR
ncbi:MAG: Rieske (2Fe-2S) protein [Candidatus Dormibacteraceae bacterium]